MLRRTSPSSASLTGGDLSVDILHTEDSVQIGDGTNLLGSFPLVGGLRSLPVANSTFATDSTLTGGTQLTQLYDPVAAASAEIDDVGGEKALKVSVIASVGGGGGGTAATDSAAYTATSSQFTPIGGAYDDVSSDALAEGEMGMCRVTSGRALHVAVQNSVAVTGTFWQATQPVSVASLPLPSGAATEASLTSIDGHVDGIEGLLTTIDADTSSISTDASAIKTSLQIMDDWDATHASAHPSDGVMVMGSNGTNAYRLRVTDSNGRLSIDVNSMPTVAVTGTFWQATQPVSIASMPATPVTDNGGSLTVDGTVAATQSGTWNIGTLTSISNTVTVAGSGNFNVVGAAAHDAAVSGNPVRVAGRAMLANGTAVAEDDTADIATDNQGRVIVTPHAPRDLITHSQGSVSSTSETTCLSAGAAGVFHDLTKVIVTNSSSTAVRAAFKDSTSGTTRFELALAANGGAVVDFGTVPCCQATAANNWTITLSGAVSSVYYYVQAVKRIA